MKILELRFKNLNSLYGEWLIDFTDPEYAAGGIFALTGPTGAGKSTILDAMCLALYGMTPRLRRINKSGNEIMSRQSGECYAEVLFESQAGRFRCHWEQRRARKKADGNLQDQEHQIADGDTGKPIETKKSLVVGVIEEKTGMDFDRFTRSIMLAQGGFDTFLKADVEQKSKILEQITGTEIYSLISQRVHERQRDERDRLNLLNAETSGIVILEPEQEKEIQQDLDAKQKQESALAVTSTETGKAITWLMTIDALRKEICSLAGETLKLQSDFEAFKPERARLELAVKAASLDGRYATITALRKQQSDDRAALKTEETALPELENVVYRQAESLRSAERLTHKNKEELKAAAPLIQKIRSLDQRLSDQLKAVLELNESCTRETEKIDADKLAQKKGQKKRADAEKALETVNEYLQKHRPDEWLTSGLTGIEEQFGYLIARQKEVVQKEQNLKKAESSAAKAKKALADSIKQSDGHRKEVEEAVKNLQRGRKALGELLGERLLREYRTEKENLLREMAFMRRIEELEDYRARLEDGKPCPLCGSKEHPYAEGNVPMADEVEQKIESLSNLIARAEEQETSIKKLEELEIAAQKNLHESERLEIKAAGDKKSIEKTLAEVNDGMEKLRSDFEELKSTVSKKLQPLGISEISKSHISTLLESLRMRLKAWQEQVAKKAELERQVTAIESDIQRLDAVIETQRKALIEKQENLKFLKKGHAEGMDERRKLFADKNPDTEENRLDKAIADAEEAEKKAREFTGEMQQKLTTAKTHIEALKKRIEQRKPDLQTAEADLLTVLKMAGFTDEKQFIEAKLPDEKRHSLSAKAKELDEAQTDLKARQKDRETRLSSEMTKKVTEKTLEELELQHKEYVESLQELREAIVGLRHRLSENRAAKKRIQEKQNVIESQKQECHRWEKLHGLIGSADGKKYRNFAQGLTFELMVSHANRQLAKMTDRYLLIRDDRQPLELNVVDHYQAGEIRSTANLSGGESFIISLTLALGLSNMASRKVRVDSLFLDEGFGTLDDEALETALETLAGLQQGGKLIGVISHVSAMKERISTQISVTPVSGGRSKLKGPGCNQVS